MLKTRRLSIILITLIFLFFGTMVLPIMAQDAENSIDEISIQSPSTAAVIPVLWMEEENVMPDVNFNIRISPNHQQGLSLISKRDIDMMITGVNVGARAFNQGIDLRLANTSIWGIDYLLTHDFKAESWEDLTEKTLSLPLKGGPLDFLARYFFWQNGIDPDEVDIVYNSNASGAKLFQMGNIDSIILPEPLVTITLNNSDKSNLSLDLQKEWGKIHDGDERIPFVGIFVTGKLAVEDSGLIERFNDYYSQGVEWVNNNPVLAAELAASKFDMPALVIKESFERINLNTFSPGEAYQLIDLYFGEILKMYPEMIGGKKPNEIFYF